MAATRPKVRVQPRRDALLLIDVQNDLSFPGADKVLPWAERLVRPLLRVSASARRAGLPVIYVNDNFGMWNSDRDAVLRHCSRKGALGSRVSAALRPKARDYFVLKPRHSAFFATPLEPLLEHLKVKRLLIAGMATNLCVLATAHDATMRGYPVVVLSDCCAAESDFDHNVVLSQLERFFHATICRSSELAFPVAKRSGNRRS